MSKSTKSIAVLGLLASLAIALAYFESLLPPITTAAPGIKMGLPNIAIIFALYRFNTRSAACVSAVRLAVITLLFGGVLPLLYSLAGAVTSLILMSVLKRIDRFSTLGVSVAGAVAHNAAQIFVAWGILGRAELLLYLPILALSGVVAGVLVGVAASLALKHTSGINI